MRQIGHIQSYCKIVAPHNTVLLIEYTIVMNSMKHVALNIHFGTTWVTKMIFENGKRWYKYENLDIL